MMLPAITPYSSTAAGKAFSSGSVVALRPVASAEKLRFEGKGKGEKTAHTPVRRLFYLSSVASVAAVELAASRVPEARMLYGALLPLMGLGIYDITQKKHAILRNFPIIGRARYLLEKIRPELRQYFWESDTDGVPFSREERENVYQRAKNELNSQPFGTKRDVYAVGYEYINHSMLAREIKEDPRVTVGGPECKQPYSASIFNISAMSFGALSAAAIKALNKGAQLGKFAHNTGEGGISPYHLVNGGDLIFQIGTGYFGARDAEGNFSPEQFKKNALRPEVKMIELKLSQGAKPGHGGILPGKKLTPEIAEIRGVPLGQDVLSPPGHSAFSNPKELLAFVKQLRELSDGKPVGIKLCIGHKYEFLAICKAMIETGITPDFISVDGGEGGTGAAPREFTDSIGMPLNDALIFVHNALVGSNLRDKVKIIAAGKITDAFDIVSKLAMGADIAYSARGFMFSLGCIQALQCNANTCPAGIATQDKYLEKGLDPADKGVRVFNYHKNTIKAVLEMVGAAGLEKVADLRPWHIKRRVTPTEIQNYSEIYEYIPPASLLGNSLPKSFERPWQAADAESFLPKIPESLAAIPSPEKTEKPAPPGLPAVS